MAYFRVNDFCQLLHIYITTVVVLLSHLQSGHVNFILKVNLKPYSSLHPYEQIIQHCQLRNLICFVLFNSKQHSWLVFFVCLVFLMTMYLGQVLLFKIRVFMYAQCWEFMATLVSSVMSFFFFFRKHHKYWVFK